MQRQLHLLAICSHPPARRVQAREALDAVLAAAVFDQRISVLFCGDGVWQLLPDQGDYSGADKALARSLEALPLYGVSELFADAESLAERGLDPGDLLDIVQVIPPARGRELMRRCDRVMSF